MLFGIKAMCFRRMRSCARRKTVVHSSPRIPSAALKGLTWREKLPLVPFQLDFPSIDSLPARDYRVQQNRPD
jgi:hypothetical protein